MDRRSDNATSVDVEIDPHCRRLGRSQTDFALQSIVECRAAKAKRVAVLLRWSRPGHGLGPTRLFEFANSMKGAAAGGLPRDAAVEDAGNRHGKPQNAAAARRVEDGPECECMSLKTPTQANFSSALGGHKRAAQMAITQHFAQSASTHPGVAQAAATGFRLSKTSRPARAAGGHMCVACV